MRITRQFRKLPRYLQERNPLGIFRGRGTGEDSARRSTNRDVATYQLDRKGKVGAITKVGDMWIRPEDNARYHQNPPVPSDDLVSRALRNMTRRSQPPRLDGDLVALDSSEEEVIARTNADGDLFPNGDCVGSGDAAFTRANGAKLETDEVQIATLYAQ